MGKKNKIQTEAQTGPREHHPNTISKQPSPKLMWRCLYQHEVVIRAGTCFCHTICSKISFSPCMKEMDLPRAAELLLNFSNQIGISMERRRWPRDELQRGNRIRVANQTRHALLQAISTHGANHKAPPSSNLLFRCSRSILGSNVPPHLVELLQSPHGQAGPTNYHQH